MPANPLSTESPPNTQSTTRAQLRPRQANQMNSRKPPRSHADATLNCTTISAMSCAVRGPRRSGRRPGLASASSSDRVVVEEHDHRPRPGRGPRSRRTRRSRPARVTGGSVRAGRVRRHVGGAVAPAGPAAATPAAAAARPALRRLLQPCGGGRVPPLRRGAEARSPCGAARSSRGGRRPRRRAAPWARRGGPPGRTSCALPPRLGVPPAHGRGRARRTQGIRRGRRLSRG